MPLYSAVFLLACVVKQFYLGASGTVQVGDVLFFSSFLLMMLSSQRQKTCTEDVYLNTFLIFVGVINAVYALFYFRIDFILSTLYYFFNYCIVLTFENLIDNESFLSWLGRVCRLNLLIQLAIYMTGRGRWYMNMRYQGTFNDPNQYGFFVLCNLFLITILLIQKEKGIRVMPWILLSLFLIMPTASTGMMLGVAIYVALFVIFPDVSSGDFARLIAIIGMIGLVILYLGITNGFIHLPAAFENSYMYERIIEKIQNVGSSSDDLLVDRGWNKVFDNPLCMLYGAGEGYFYRFKASGNEVHSSILGPLFYYGIIPCSFLVRWYKSKLVGVKKATWCVYIALFVESITLINTRQPFFWMLLVLAGDYWTKNEYYRYNLDYCNQSSES